LIDLIGSIGGICLALSALPQAIKILKEGHANGIASGSIWLWGIGSAALTSYVLVKHSTDLILVINYLFNLSLVLVAFKYKYWPKR